MEDQPIFNEKDLWVLNEVKTSLETAQHKLEECNDHYLARTIILDQFYLDVQALLSRVENLQAYASKNKIINHFNEDWLDKRDMRELKGDRR